MREGIREDGIQEVKYEDCFKVEFVEIILKLNIEIC